MRIPLIAGNWKMNTSIEDGVSLADQISKLVADLENNEVGVAIAPPFTHIAEIARVIDKDRCCLSAQNCASESSGAFTGEVSAAMLDTFAEFEF